MAQKPGIPKGTRDFSPTEVARRQYIMQVMRTNFEKSGYQPIETPSFENSETLMGKYGEEGDRLIFKILNSGNYLEFTTLVESYLKVVFRKILVELADAYRKETNHQLDKIIPILISKSLIQKIVNDVNRSNPELAFKNFHSPGFIAAIRKEIISLQKSEYITEKFIVDVIQDCEDCNLEQNEKINNFVDRISQDTFGKWFSSVKTNELTKHISEKALRYDLTVPFARYVVQHQNEIQFPFKRYQIQPVWRADRPQNGRFREFFQCDADVVGSDSLWQEVELVQLYDSVFTELGLEKTRIKINNRKILSGIADVIGAGDKLIDFTVALDKLDKIGIDGVRKEMLEKGIGENAIEKLAPLFELSGDFMAQLEQLSQLLSESEDGKKGIEELRFIGMNIENLGLQSCELELDVTLARGLNYYTGAIFEVVAQGVELGSIGGGGRYDDLTGIFGLKDKSGVGISFGLDRIYIVLDKLNLFPQSVQNAPVALFINNGPAEAEFAMQAITKLRRNGFRVELYPDAAKSMKQFTYAEKRGIPYVVIIGEQELIDGNFTIKQLATGEKFTSDPDAIASFFGESQTL